MAAISLKWQQPFLGSIYYLDDFKTCCQDYTQKYDKIELLDIYRRIVHALQDTWHEAMRARNEGIAILVVGVGDGVNQMELQGMASPPSALNIFRSASFDLLNQELARKIAFPVCKSMWMILVIACFLCMLRCLNSECGQVEGV